MNTLPKRLLSIEVFRAVTMFLMIFVNDASSVSNIPAWIDHVKENADGLGFADTIFPAFLFIVGLSLPFSIKNRMNKGDSFSAIAIYILTRSLALIVMGFFHVNLEEYSKAAILPRAVWEILITIGFFLIWLDYPPSLTKAKRNALMGAGILLLLAMAYLFKGGDPQSPDGLKTSWWGILGIIGWAYLVCASVFLIAKGKLSILLTALVLFAVINIMSHAGLFHFHIWLIGDASSVSLIMAGAVISVLYADLSAKNQLPQLWWFLTVAGIAMLIAGFIVRPYAGGISKIHSTPAWVFICTGISILVFEQIIYATDIKGKHNWFKAIRPAGTSTLTCYLIPYLLYSVYALVHFNYPQFLNTGAGGLLRSFAVAFAVILIAGVMERRRIRLKI